MGQLSGVQSQVFRPLPDILRSDAIVDRLTTAITLGLLRQGEQLPPENQLTSMLGVASATVRDALQTLRDRGIIETRRGRSGGTFVVSTPSADPVSLHERLVQFSMAELRDLADEQASNGMAAVRLASERAFDHDFDRLASIADLMAEADSEVACMRADFRFHIELTVLAQSERLMQTEMRLLSESVEMLWSVLDWERDRVWAASDHHAIVDALRDGDTEGAQAVIRDHVAHKIYRLVESRLDAMYPGGRTSTTDATHVRDTVTSVAAWFVALFDDLTTLATDSATAFAFVRGRRTDLHARDLRSAEPGADRFLSKHPTFEAAGVILRPGIVATEGNIEWWKREADGSLRTMLFALTPHAAGFYDFETLEWFSNVVTTGQPTLTGPYLDYAGMDKYIVTTTVPLREGDTIVGAAGCDIETRALETALMPMLRHLRDDAAIIDRHSRVILGNSGRFLIGNRVTTLPTGADVIDVPVHELGLRLITAPRETR